MTIETFERVKEIANTLYDISVKSKRLAEMKKQNRQEYHFSDGWVNIAMSRDLGETFICLIEEYYKQQTEKLEKEIKEL